MISWIYLHETAYNAILMALVPVSLFYLSKLLWRTYILRSARDPATDLSHLPIPPGDFGLPIIGETMTWAIQGSDFNIIRRKKYGNIYSSNYIGKTMVKVTGPEYIKQILTGKTEEIQTIWPDSVRRVVGESAMANSIGALHKYRRKIFLRGFTRDALQGYLPRIHRIIKHQMRSWSSSEDIIHIYPITKRMTFEVAFTIIVGLAFKDESEKETIFELFDSMITNLFSLPIEFPGSSFSKALKAKEKLHVLLDGHVREKREKVRRDVENNKFAADSTDESMKNSMHIVLESLIMDEKRKQNGRQETESGDEAKPEPNTDLSDTELKETTTEMLFAGYQTVASSATSAVINLIKHPECFRKVEDELREFGLMSDESNNPDSYANERVKSDINCNPTTEGAGDITECLPGDDVTLEKLSRMPYLEQLMKETLRINPPILGGYRKAMKTFQLGKYRVPKGWTIIYNIRDTHEAEWEDDRAFNPDRFANDKCKADRDLKYRWIPFGGGPRICVGREFARMQFKLFIIEFVRTFRKVEFADGKQPKMFAIPFLHPTNGLPVKLTARHAATEARKKNQ